MVQFGLNRGPRHAKVTGWSVSFKKKLGDSAKVVQDQDIIGMTSIIFKLVKAHMPREISAHVEQRLEELNLPRAASRQVAPGMLQ